MRYNIEMDDLTSIMQQDYETVQVAEGQCRNNARDASQRILSRHFPKQLTNLLNDLRTAQGPWSYMYGKPCLSHNEKLKIGSVCLLPKNCARTDRYHDDENSYSRDRQRVKRRRRLRHPCHRGVIERRQSHCGR